MPATPKVAPLIIANFNFASEANRKILKNLTNVIFTEFKVFILGVQVFTVKVYALAKHSQTFKDNSIPKFWFHLVIFRS